AEDRPPPRGECEEGQRSNDRLVRTRRARVDDGGVRPWIGGAGERSHLFVRLVRDGSDEYEMRAAWLQPDRGPGYADAPPSRSRGLERAVYRGPRGDRTLSKTTTASTRKRRCGTRIASTPAAIARASTKETSSRARPS